MLHNQHDLAELRALNARFIHNYVTRDVVAHDALIHSRFVYLSSQGMRVDRATYLRNWATDFDAARLPYWDMRDECIDVFGDFALVRATNKYVQRLDGQDMTRMATYTDAYVREHGRWWCVQAQIGEVIPEHWPGDDTIVCRYVDGRLQP
jgi:Domain of unknown function (DUF4440)